MKRLRYPILILAAYALLCGLSLGGHSPIVLLQRVDAAPAPAPATRPVLGVGPSEPYKTIPDALQHSIAGDTIILDDGTYALTAPLDLNRKGLTFAAANPGQATLVFTGTKEYQQAVKVSADNVTVRDINVRGDNCHDVSVSPTKGVKLIAVHSLGTLHGFDFDSVDSLLLQQCTATRKSGYVYFVHGNQVTGTRCGKITVDRCQGGGSDGQHNFRCNSVDEISFDGCDFAFAADSSNGKFSAGITVRAGVGKFSANNCDIYGLWVGPKIGPGADHEGDTVGSATVTNCRIKGGYLALYRGLGKATVSDCTVAADRSGSAVSVDDGVPGELARLTITYAGGKAFNRAAMPAGMTLTGPITFNGALIVPAPVVAPPNPTPAQKAAAIGTQIKAIPGMPAQAWPLIDQLTAMAK